MKSPAQIKRIAEERASLRAGGNKCDRAYELHAKGISHAAIAERLGLSPKAVSTMIKNGHDRHRQGKQS